MKGFYTRSQIIDKFKDEYNNNLKNQIFKIQHRILANIIPNQDVEIDNLVRKTFEGNTEEADFVDYFAPQESLNC